MADLGLVEEGGMFFFNVPHRQIGFVSCALVRVFAAFVASGAWAEPPTPAAAADASKAQIQIVFDLQRSLVQGVPADLAKELGTSKVVEIEGKFYALADDAARTLRRLRQDPRVRITVSSELPKAAVQQIVAGLPIDAIVPAGLWCKGQSRCVWVTDDAAPVAKRAEAAEFRIPVKTGPTLFHFNTFKQAAEKKAASQERGGEWFESNKQSFPASAAQWALHRKRLHGVFYPVSEALRASKADANVPFEKVLAEAAALPLAERERRAAQILNSRPWWKIENGRVIGCEEQDPGRPVPASRAAEHFVCVAELPTKLAWSGPGGDQCVRRTADGAAVVADEPVEVCIAGLKTRYLWSDRELGRCGAFNEAMVFVAEAAKEKCTLDIVCDTSTGVLSTFARDLAKQVVFKIQPSYEAAERAAAIGVSSLARAGSFASLLRGKKGPAATAIESALGTECTDFIRKIYLRGQTLSSSALARAAKSATQIPYKSGVRDLKFFHYTKSAEMIAMFYPGIKDREVAHERSLREGAYVKVLTFLKSLEGSASLWRRVFYVAEDPVSTSDSYGEHRLELTLNPSATVIDYLSPAWAAATQELERRYPGFKTICSFSGMPSSTDSYDNNPYFLIADDSGIDLIDYGRGWSQAPGDHSWFQLLSFKSVVRNNAR